MAGSRIDPGVHYLEVGENVGCGGGDALIVPAAAARRPSGLVPQVSQRLQFHLQIRSHWDQFGDPDVIQVIKGRGVSFLGLRFDQSCWWVVLVVVLVVVLILGVVCGSRRRPGGRRRGGARGYGGGGLVTGGFIAGGLLTGGLGGQGGSSAGFRPSGHGSGGFGSGGHGSGGFGSSGHGSGGFGSSGHGSGGFGSSGHGSGGFGSGGYGSGGSSDCRYWCKAGNNRYYCCETPDQALKPVGVHSGRCPPVRPICPATRIGPPRQCSNDGSCSWKDKCCYDTCLEHHVCKPAIRW